MDNLFDEERLSAALLLLCKRGVQNVPADELEQLQLSRDALADHIAKIVQQNLTSGRIERVMLKSGQHQTLSLPVLQSYVDRVIETYLKESPRVTALLKNDEEAWTEFDQWLIKRTHSALRKLFTSDASAPDPADFSQEACQVLIKKLPEYHYDASFEAWVTVILRNIILKRYMRSRDIIDRNPSVASLDRPIKSQSSEGASLWELLADSSQLATFEQVENRMLIVDALKQLKSKAQQTVIIYTYFYQLPDAEIGQLLNKSPNNIAQLRFRALRNLRKILEDAKT